MKIKEKSINTAHKWNLKWMAWEVTSQCNMNCIHCRSSSNYNSSKGRFTLELSKNFLTDISSFSSPVVVLTGGEALLREDIFDISQFGTDMGLKMALATNGLLIDNNICKHIKESGIKIVSLSLDGPTSSIHDDFRKQAGAFEAAINASKLFKQHNIKFIINSSFTKRNQKYIPETYKLAKTLGAEAWYMFMIVPTGRGKELRNELISENDYEEILNWHYDIERNEDEILMRPTCAPNYYRIWSQKSITENSTRRSLTFSTGGGKGCIAGQSILFVNSEGDVYPCSYFPLSSGNIFEEKLENIWNNSKLFKELRDFKKYEGKCGQCKYINVCGGCRARAYAVNGSYMSEEPFCSYIKD